MTRDDYIFLGTIVKTRGISGELIIRIKKKNLQINSHWESVWIEIDGLLVPFFISSYFSTLNNEISITLEDIDFPQKAEKLKGRDVYIHKSIVVDPSDEFPPDQIRGYMVIDIHSGMIGKITGIDDIPGNSLFRVEHGDQEILIPMHEDLILEINEGEKSILVDLPDGFLEI